MDHETTSQQLYPPEALFPDRYLLEQVARNQKAIEVKFVNFEGQVEKGLVIVHKLVVEDVHDLFAIMLKLKFPLQSVRPINEFSWSDQQSMEMNNSSAYNPRWTPDGRKLSLHSYGIALDLNPRLNPYIRLAQKPGEKNVNQPQGAQYLPEAVGTFTTDESHGNISIQVIAEFKKRGWIWGGNWHALYPDRANIFDYHHFEKPLNLETILG